MTDYLKTRLQVTKEKKNNCTLFWILSLICKYRYNSPNVLLHSYYLNFLIYFHISLNNLWIRFQLILNKFWPTIKLKLFISHRAFQGTEIEGSFVIVDRNVYTIQCLQKRGTKIGWDCLNIPFCTWFYFSCVL